MNKIILLAIFAFATLISLFAENIDPKLRLELEQFATKQGYKNGENINFIKLPSIVDRNVERYQIYNNEYRMGGKKNNYLCEMILVYQDSLYYFPKDYNRFVYDIRDEITEENVFEKVEELIKLWTTVDVEIDSIEFKNLSYSAKEKINASREDIYWGGYAYNIEAISYSKEYGIRMKWNIGFHKGKFDNINSITIAFPENRIFYRPAVHQNIFSLIELDKSKPKSRLTYEERFMETLESSEKYNDPLLAKVFPDVEFYLQVSKRIGSDDFRIAALYQDKHYLMPSRFNEVYELIEEESTSIIEDRIGAYVKMIYIRRSERRYARTKEIMNVTDVVVSKDSSYVDIVRFNYKVEFKLEGKNRKAYFWIDDGQIKRIRIEDQIGSLSLIKPAVASKSRNIENN